MKSFYSIRPVEKVKYAVRMISIDELENVVKKKWYTRGVVRSRHVGLTTRKHLRSTLQTDGSAESRPRAILAHVPWTHIYHQLLIQKITYLLRVYNYLLFAQFETT